MECRIASLLGRSLAAFAAFILATPMLHAQESAPPARPRIGLVLAGGGAKGGAHVGILKVLEEMRVPVDCIAGTSMGALVGAGYASGQTAAEIEKFLRGVQWNSVIGSAGRRDLEPIEQKRAGVTYSNELEFGIKGGRIIVPGGIVDTARIENLLRVYVARARMEADFDKLPIPFRAVATDMLTGRMVVLAEGDIATAMRASMAIPGAFAAVPLGNQVLADGGMVRNIPVDVARGLCADVVIVSNLVEPDVKPEQLQSAVQLLGRSLDVMISANEEAQLATLTDRDVRIDTFTGDIGTASFERVPETIPMGEAAARAAVAALRKYSLPEREYAAWRERVTATQGMDVRVAEVTFKGLEHVNPAYLLSRTNVKAGDAVDVSRISEDALRLSALQDFDSVGYTLIGDPRNATLEWEPHEKTWGPDYMKFDLGVYASAGGDLAFAVDVQHTRNWVNSLGGQWRNELQFGYENKLETRFYQPLDAAQRWFVEPRAAGQQNIEDLYVGGDRLAKYVYSDLGASLDFGGNFGRYTQARVGYGYVDRNFRRDTGSPLLPEGSSSDGGFTTVVTHDSRDKRFSATRGWAAVMEYTLADESLGGDRNWQRGELAVATTIPLGSNLIWTTLAGGTDFNSNLPFDRMFSLGGPGSFPGFELGEMRARDYASLSGSYLYKLADIISLRGQAIYVGIRLQAAEVNRLDPLGTETEDSIYGGSLFLTGSTPVGPLTLGYGKTTSDAWSLWLAIGRPIGHGTVMERGIFR
mgnify:CR=1 FL=1